MSNPALLLLMASVALIAFAAVALMTPLVARLARRLGAVDHPGERRMHSTPTPRMGGLAIAAGAALAMIPVLSIPGIGNYGPRTLMAVFAATCGMLALGAVDDCRPVPHLQKLMIQFLLAYLCWKFGVRIRGLSLPFFEAVHLPRAAGMILTLLWIVGVTNAINLLDGLDGLAAGVAAIVFATLMLIGVIGGPYNIFLMAASAALAAACVSFLLYNGSPARIFMGDTGSLFLGFLLANIAVLSSQKSTTATALGIPIIALGVPIADTLIAIGRRLIQGRSPFVADRHHLHHVLHRIGLRQGLAVAVIYGGTGLLCCFALLAVIVGQSALLFGGAALLAGLVWLWLLIRRRGIAIGHDPSAVPQPLPEATPHPQ